MNEERMTGQFSPIVSEILAFSREEALRLASSSVGPEHLLLGMLRIKESSVYGLFLQLNVDLEQIKKDLEQKVRGNNLNMPADMTDLMLNEKASNVLRLAVLEARIKHEETVNEQHLLLAILHDQVPNGAKQVLEANNMKYDTVFSLLQTPQQTPFKSGIGLPDEEEEDFEELGAQGNNRQKVSAATQSKKESKTPVLDHFGTNLTEAALNGKLDPCVGREREIQRVIEILGRRKKNNPILIGEPGVGKSAIVEGLAQMIAERHTSPMFFGKKVYTLDMTAIVAGTKYRGQFEERLRQLMQELERNDDIIVFIDEIHTIIGAGSTPGSMDAANIMKPALARGVIQCIGATTTDEYRNSIEKDGALERRFQKVVVEPTTNEQTLQILYNIKDRYEKHHHVSYTDDALEACVKLTDRYINDRFMPDKAIDALDEVGSRLHIGNMQVPPEITAKEQELIDTKQHKQSAVRNQNYELAAGYRDKELLLQKELDALNQKWIDGENDQRQIVTGKEVADVVSMMTGVPVQRMADQEMVRLKGMAPQLKKEVIAQDTAIDKMVRAIQRNRVGLKDPKHPIGAFMFLGPTGVGKTYLAKKLAEFMFGSADALIRVDMSEFTESFNTSRLIGAPPGYVGYEQGGQLTEQVRRRPYSIVLLDEIEKAHPNVYNLLLQVLDEGRLTDGNGRFVDFRNTVIIMTSNTGTRQLKDFGRGIGFGASSSHGAALNDADKQHARSVVNKALSKQFAPEFLNRLDEIITFDQLDLNAIKRIIDIELKVLYQRIAEMGYTIRLNDEAKEFVATKGYDVQFGARPLKRAIQNYVEDEVCERIINGNINSGDVIQITKDPEKEALIFENVPMSSSQKREQVEDSSQE